MSCCLINLNLGSFITLVACTLWGGESKFAVVHSQIFRLDLAFKDQTHKTIHNILFERLKQIAFASRFARIILVQAPKPYRPGLKKSPQEVFWP